MTMSAPSDRATSTGRLRAMLPSTNNKPSISTGVSTAGIAMLARIANARLPFASTTMSPLATSVAMARNGIGN